MKHGIALLLQTLLLGINTQKDGGGAGKEEKKKLTSWVWFDLP